MFYHNNSSFFVQTYKLFENTLIIKDNAAGISREDLEERALKTGRPALDTSIGLGKHGVGMKAAGLWWGEKIVIDTFPLNEKNGWHIELDISEQDNQKKIVRSIKIPHRGYSGTIITIEKLCENTSKHPNINDFPGKFKQQPKLKQNVEFNFETKFSERLSTG